MPCVVPAEIAVHLISWIETLALDEALGQTQGHRRIVCPLAGLEPEGSTSYNILYRCKRARRLEFYCGAKRVTHCESEQAASIATR